MGVLELEKVKKCLDSTQYRCLCWKEGDWYHVVLEKLVGELISSRRILYQGPDASKAQEVNLTGQYICTMLLSGRSPQRAMEEAAYFLDICTEIQPIQPESMVLHVIDIAPEIVWIHKDDPRCIFIVTPGHETEIYR